MHYQGDRTGGYYPVRRYSVPPGFALWLAWRTGSGGDPGSAADPGPHDYLAWRERSHLTPSQPGQELERANECLSQAVDDLPWSDDDSPH